jgi:hypothetical protein
MSTSGEVHRRDGLGHLRVRPEDAKNILPDAFGPQGRMVLLLIGGLPGLGWILVSLPKPTAPG